MTDAVYERYKEALRRGHVAALRGRLDAALVAYREAAGIAPERALPHASLGSVLVRLERREEALAAFGAALDRAPRDEAALAGRADALAGLGRRVEAADALDRLAEIEETAGRVAEACDTARRALELAESRSRRQHVAALARRLREVPADEAAAAALERAMSLLEPGSGGGDADRAPATPSGGDAASGTDEGLAHVDGTSPADADAVPEVGAPPDPNRLAAEAEDAIDEGRADAARELLLAAARAHREAGSLNSALDACYLALSVGPADPATHLALTELWLDRGWRGPAIEKLVLLRRLVELEGDAAAAERLMALVEDRLPDEPRLVATGG